MPAKSKAQQIAAAIAKHNPGKLYKRNKGLAKAGKGELSKLASTSTKNLPYKKK